MRNAGNLSQRVLVVLFVLAAALPARAQVVDSFTDDVDENPSDGVCRTSLGMCSLRAALEQANATPGDDHIALLNHGTYFLTLGQLIVTDTVGTLFLEGAGPTHIVIENYPGTVTERILEISAGTKVNIAGVTITGGHALNVGHGGGILNAGTLALTNVVIKNCRAFQGGGVAHEPPVSTATLTLTNTTIDSNEASDGGGIYINRLRTGVTIVGSTISNNTATFGGGGIYSVNGTVVITNSTVSGNAASPSASSGPGGGGIVVGRELSLNNVTITNNSAGFGGGVRVTAGSFAFANSVIAGNHSIFAPDCYVTADSPRSFGYNVVGDGTECPFTHAILGILDTDRVGSTVTPIDPKLGPLAGTPGFPWTHTPLSNSPLLDTGTPIAPGPPPTLRVAGQFPCAATDQRGVVRPEDGDGDGIKVCDVGAVEGSAALTAPVPVVVGVRAEAKIEVAGLYAETVGPVVNTDGDPGSATAIAQPFIAPLAAKGDATADLPPRPIADTDVISNLGKLHSLSTAGCCMVVPGAGVDSRASSSNARLVRKFVATSRTGTIDPTLPAVVKVEVPVDIHGTLYVETPWSTDRVCGNPCPPPPLFPRDLSATVNATVTAFTSTAPGGFSVFNQKATLDLADVRVGAFAADPLWAGLWTFSAGQTTGRAELSPLLTLLTLPFTPFEVPLCSTPTTPSLCASFAIEMTLSTAAFSRYFGGATADFSHTAGFTVRVSASDPRRDDIVLVEVDDHGNPVPLITPGPDDLDFDLIAAATDNCPTIFNRDQEDADSDGIGDRCDNARTMANSDQADADGDGVGDAGDNCRIVANDTQVDSDNDGAGDRCDICPLDANGDQADGDGDGVGDACDPDPNDGPLGDRDTDGIPNAQDNCPSASNADQSDLDRDGFGDVCDPTPMPTIDGRILGAALSFHDRHPEVIALDVAVKSGIVGARSRLTYLASAKPLLLVATTIERVTIADRTATVEGAAMVNGMHGYHFTAVVVDGSPDEFGITIRRPDGTIRYQRQQTVKEGALRIVR
jgi:CSLREA domain-containing protein